MAKQVKVAAVRGNTVITADGQRLRIIGNAMPGGYVWTDGVVAYGYSLPGTIVKKPAVKRIPTSYPLYDVGGYYDEHWRYLCYLPKPYTNDVTLFDFDDLENPVQYWPGRPAFFNDGKNFYSLRGSWTNPVLYSSANQQGQALQGRGRKLFLGYIPGLGQVWQSGNLCETFSNIAAKTYTDNTYDVVGSTEQYYTYTKQSSHPGQIWDSSGAPFVTYSLQGSNLNDLTIEYDNGSIALSPIVNDILDELHSILDAAADESIPWGEPMTPYPAARPNPVTLSYSLAGNGDNRLFKIGYSYPPCDNLTAQGGCPLFDVDFSRYSEFNGRSMSDASKDCKIIHNVRKINNSIVFELFLIGHFVFYKYYETLAPGGSGSTTYDPPLPSGGCYRWVAREIGYRGRWRVTVSGGSVSLKHIEQYWNAYPYHYNMPALLNNKTFANTLDFGNGWVFDTYESTPGNESGRVRHLGTGGEADVTYPENYGYVNDIVKVGNKECLVFAPYDGICHYVNDALVGTVGGGYSANDSFVAIDKPDRLLNFYNRLANVPYYELDN